MRHENAPFKSKAITRAEVEAETATRAAVAKMLELHPDSVSRLLASGLASAVVEWGGSGKTMTFSVALVRRWDRARGCRRRDSRPCFDCAGVLEDAQCTSEHLLEARHSCLTPCDDPDGCGHHGNWCGPC